MKFTILSTTITTLLLATLTSTSPTLGVTPLQAKISDLKPYGDVNTNAGVVAVQLEVSTTEAYFVTVPLVPAEGVYRSGEYVAYWSPKEFISKAVFIKMSHGVPKEKVECRAFRNEDGTGYVLTFDGSKPYWELEKGVTIKSLRCKQIGELRTGS
jgi:hypothetical protein